MSDSFWAYAWALRLHLSGSHFAACAVESSQTCIATLWSPAFQSCCSSSSFVAPTICNVCVRELPCIGKSVAMSTSGSPLPLYWSGSQDDAGSAVTFPPPPLELLLPPQPAAAKASTPMSMASRPSVPYLLKMDTSVARSLSITRKVGSIEAFQGLSNPEPLECVKGRCRRWDLNPHEVSLTGF